jgi:putative nucleotidyltransferase with HDIG domain
MKKRILFVDDERQVLDGLRNRLRHKRHSWDMTFVEGGTAALETLGRERFDVIVSDLRMPGMDGSELLQRVREQHPGVARIVLSGHADEAAMLRAIATAHQFLPKPCEPGLLEDIVGRVSNLQTVVADEALKDTIGKIGVLPSPPGVYSRLLAALADTGSYPENVVRIVGEDSALTAQMLHIVNSAYFGLTHPIVSVQEAVVHLGLGTVRQLVLAAEVFRGTQVPTPFPRMSMENLHRHALQAAKIASALFSEKDQKETAFVAALLHDIGKLLLITVVPDRVRVIVSEMEISGESMFAVETRLFGITHAEIGAYLLGLWQIPFPVIEAVADHHSPARAGDRGDFSLVAAIHVADALVNEFMEPVSDETTRRSAMLDTSYLDKIGVSTKVPQWREMARQLVGSISERQGAVG